MQGCAHMRAGVLRLMLTPHFDPCSPPQAATWCWSRSLACLRWAGRGGERAAVRASAARAVPAASLGRMPSRCGPVFTLRRHAAPLPPLAPPQVINDGVSIARAIELPDPVENAGAQLVKEVGATGCARTRVCVCVCLCVFVCVCARVCAFACGCGYGCVHARTHARACYVCARWCCLFECAHAHRLH